MLSKWFFLLISINIGLILTKGGGGRGFSGARSSSASRGSSSSKPSYSNGRSFSSRQYNSNFRSSIFHTTSTTTMFTYSPIFHSHIIISPMVPMHYGGYNYYWGGYYTHDLQRPIRCDYQISEDDEELRNVTFSNGTTPTTLTFGCKNSESCCGMECCSSGAIWTFGTAVFLLISIILCILCVRSCCNQGCSDTEIPTITTTTITTTRAPFAYPPSPPQYTQSDETISAPPSFLSNGRPTSVSNIRTSMIKT